MKKLIIKPTLFTILTIWMFNISFGQSELKIDKSDNSRLIKVLNNSKLLAETKTKDLSIRIYKIDNEPGSAGNESGEVTHNLLIAVSEFDEYPIQNLFEIGSMYNPKFKEWNRQDLQKDIVIEYGPFNQPKTLTLSVNINELKIKK